MKQCRLGCVVATLTAIWLVACSESDDASGGDDAGADGTVSAADAGADTSSASEAGADCQGGWLDSAAGLCWQEPADGTERTFQEAIDYCDTLTQGGHEDWRMPSIDELRSLVVGCPSTAADGICPVSAGSASEDHTDACSGCGSQAGQCYWSPSLTGPCDWFHWSSSVVADYPDSGAWMMYFLTGSVNWEAQMEPFYARCVRTAS